MDIQEVAKLEKGTKVYQVDGTVIRGLFLLAEHPKGYEYIYLIKDESVSDVVCFYLPKKYNSFFTLSYEEAKEKMWENLKASVESKNKIFMGGSKKFSFD